MLGVGAIPAIMQGLLSLLIMPETPYFLMRNGRQEEAERVIKRFYYDQAACNQEIDILLEAFNTDAL